MFEYPSILLSLIIILPQNQINFIKIVTFVISLFLFLWLLFDISTLRYILLGSWGEFFLELWWLLSGWG
jgi:hypothetical protein